jgi:mRNA interferase RelE/StbE
VASYRPEIGAQVSEVILRHLPPDVQRALRAAIGALAFNPSAGEPLHAELEGRFEYRVRRYRIIYRADRAARILRIVAVGHRRSIYEELAARNKDGE